MASDRLQCKRKQLGFRMPLLRLPFTSLGCRLRCNRSYDVHVDPSQNIHGQWMSTEVGSASPDLRVETGLYQGGRTNGAFDQHVMHCVGLETAQDIVALEQDATDTTSDEKMDCIQISNKDSAFPHIEHSHCSDGVEMLPAEVDCDLATLSDYDSEPSCSSQNQNKPAVPPSSEDTSSDITNMETDSYVDPETGERGLG